LSEPSPKTPSKRATHVHPDSRAHVAASNSVAKLTGISPEDPLPISYYSSELIQCTLPHSDPKTPGWARRNGKFALIVSSGIDKNGEVIGIPYGSFPRLALAHIITRVIETKQRRIDLSGHFTGFLRDVGYTGNYKGNGANGQRIRDQLLRLLNATISFEYADETRNTRRNISIAPKFDLWWSFNKPDEGTLFGSWIELSEDFYNAIMQSPVPLKTDALKALHRSPLALDVYMWVSYRLFAMESSGREDLTVSFEALQSQFGTGISEGNVRQFRSELKLAFKKVAEHWSSSTDPSDRRDLNYEFNTQGLVLYRSPLLIVRKRRSSPSQDINKLLESHKFDNETRKKARQITGPWDLDYLIEQYFDWIKVEGIKPEAPQAHFLSFIRAHRERNG